MAADLADPHGVDRVLSAVADLEVDVLVNNAGVGYAGRLDKQDPGRLRALVQVNCVAPVVLTARLLPAMRARGRGAVIITGSIAGHQPLPRLAAYSASKGFDRLTLNAFEGNRHAREVYVKRGFAAETIRYVKFLG